MPNKNYNILTAITNLVNCQSLKLKGISESDNRANQMGDKLEIFIKELFSSTLNISSITRKMKEWNRVFSYIGNTNNPPDLMLKNGDAIEVKKLNNETAQLALNSSYPKCKLYADNPLLTNDCRNAEIWSVKDVIYAVGSVNENSLTSLTLVYGEDYAADQSIYQRIRECLRTGIGQIQDIDFGETQELARINRVDPLGITYLRIRGMWGIENPLKVFNYIYEKPQNCSFHLMAIINEDKYDKLEGKDSFDQLFLSTNELKIETVDIKNPNNPAQFKKAKLISYFR